MTLRLARYLARLGSVVALVLSLCAGMGSCAPLELWLALLRWTSPPSAVGSLFVLALRGCAALAGLRSAS